MKKYKLLVDVFDHKAGEVIEADQLDNVFLFFSFNNPFNGSLPQKIENMKFSIHAPSYPNMFKLVEEPKYTDGDLDKLFEDIMEFNPSSQLWRNWIGTEIKNLKERKSK